MNIADMHIMFRQLAQQMGMQNVRAILPEQIDLLLNTAIIDVVNEIIKRNIAGTNDRVITDNSKIGQINALSTLYKDTEVSIFNTKSDGGFILNGGVSSINTVMTTGFEFDITCSEKPQIEPTAIPSDYMYICDFNINYYSGRNEGNTRLKTDWFPVRIIDDIYIADALNDFILGPSFRSPIAHLVNRQEGHIRIRIYIDRKKNGRSNIPNGVIPSNLRISYVAKPATVKYSEDVGSSNVNCNLPEYLHGDIVKRAVDLYHASISGSLLSAQAKERAQQQEAMRNNYRQGDDSQAAQ
jgi:hypothetical protein